MDTIKNISAYDFFSNKYNIEAYKDPIIYSVIIGVIIFFYIKSMDAPLLYLILIIIPLLSLILYKIQEKCKKYYELKLTKFNNQLSVIKKSLNNYV